MDKSKLAAELRKYTASCDFSDDYLVDAFAGYVAQLCNANPALDFGINTFIRKMWSWPEDFRIPAYMLGYDQPCTVFPGVENGKIDFSRQGDFEKTAAAFAEDLLK